MLPHNVNRVEHKILMALASSGKSIWELLDLTNCTLTDFIKALKKLSNDGLITLDSGLFHLTEKGKRQVNPYALKFEAKICPACRGQRIIPEGKFRELLEDYKRISLTRPAPKLDYFQGYMVAQDVVSRVALMHYYGDLEGKSIVMIGDDDLLSVALALTRLPSRILVLDVDARLGEFLEKINREYDFYIDFMHYDVAEPLPGDLKGSFDVFSSEPLETLSGLKAFIGRGVACLKENGAGYFGLTHYEASLKKWLAIQRLLSRMNCVLTDLIQGFSAYPMNYGDMSYEDFVNYLGFDVGKNPGINWYKSALFRFEVLGKPRLVIDPSKKVKVKCIDEIEDVTHPSLYSTV